MFIDIDFQGLWQQITDFFTSFAQTYGYLGLFLAVLICDASIILPLPGYAVIIALSSVLNPIHVAIVSAIAGTIGEFTTYFLGLGTKRLTDTETEHMREIYEKYGLWTIYIFACTPLPFDIISIVCGFLGVNPAVYAFFTLLGKFTLYTVLAYQGKTLFDMIAQITQGEINMYSILFLAFLVAIIVISIYIAKRLYK
jgi:membrane protein YqaA with SNARE-associated domain